MILMKEKLRFNNFREKIVDLTEKIWTGTDFLLNIISIFLETHNFNGYWSIYTGYATIMQSVSGGYPKFFF